MSSPAFERWAALDLTVRIAKNEPFPQDPRELVVRLSVVRNRLRDVVRYCTSNCFMPCLPLSPKRISFSRRVEAGAGCRRPFLALLCAEYKQPALVSDSITPPRFPSPDPDGVHTAGTAGPADVQIQVLIPPELLTGRARGASPDATGE